MEQNKKQPEVTLPEFKYKKPLFRIGEIVVIKSVENIHRQAEVKAADFLPAIADWRWVYAVEHGAQNGTRIDGKVVVLEESQISKLK